MHTMENNDVAYLGAVRGGRTRNIIGQKIDQVGVNVMI